MFKLCFIFSYINLLLAALKLYFKKKYVKMGHPSQRDQNRHDSCMFYHVVLSPCIKYMVVNERFHKQKNIPSWYMQFQFTMLVLLVQTTLS